MVCKRQMKDSDHNTLMERRMNMGRRVARGVMMAQKELMDVLDTSDPQADPDDEDDTTVARSVLNYTSLFMRRVFLNTSFWLQLKGGSATIIIVLVVAFFSVILLPK